MHTASEKENRIDGIFETSGPLYVFLFRCAILMVIAFIAALLSKGPIHVAYGFLIWVGLAQIISTPVALSYRISRTDPGSMSEGMPGVIQVGRRHSGAGFLPFWIMVGVFIVVDLSDWSGTNVAATDFLRAAGWYVFIGLAAVCATSWFRSKSVIVVSDDARFFLLNMVMLQNRGLSLLRWEVATHEADFFRAAVEISDQTMKDDPIYMDFVAAGHDWVTPPTTLRHRLDIAERQLNAVTQQFQSSKRGRDLLSAAESGYQGVGAPMTNSQRRNDPHTKERVEYWASLESTRDKSSSRWKPHPKKSPKGNN